MFYVLDHLQEMVPLEVRDHPMSRMLITFIKEAKKDLRRMDSDFILALSKPIGEAFVWISQANETEPFEEITTDDDDDDDDDDSDDDDSDFDDDAEDMLNSLLAENAH